MVKSTGQRRDPKAATGNIATFALRMPEGLKQAIEEAAEANGRSINSEICERLQSSLVRQRLAENDDIGLPLEDMQHLITQHMEVYVQDSLSNLESRVKSLEDDLKKLKK